MKKVLLGMAFLVLGAAACWADTGADLAAENVELKQRVDNLEKELAEIKSMLKQQLEAKPAPAPVAAEESRLSQADIDKILEAVQADMGRKKPVWSTLDIELYGYIKADASWDSSRITAGDYIKWVDSGGEDDDEFNLTANQTRIGLKIAGPEVDGLKTSGLLEGDFYGTGGVENKPNFRMRHAYMTLDWPDERFSILAGQTWDVISPLWPDTLNFTIGWDGGNIGHRHPQIRLTKEMALCDDVDLSLKGAISRTIGDNAIMAEAGEDSGFPTLQGRVGLTFPMLAYKPTTIGFSGHWGEEEYGAKDVDSWSVNVDLTQPINEWLTIKGEAFCGSNLDNYFGGIEQGVNPTTLSGIGSRGGWVAASFGPCDKWTFNTGMGIDDPKNGDLEGMAKARAVNRSIFGNAIYSINENTKVGIELSQWRTEYVGGGEDADDLRVQTSFIYSF
jgi:hypothetical protein